MENRLTMAQYKEYTGFQHLQPGWPEWQPMPDGSWRELLTLRTPDSLRQKVNADGSLRDFFGTTVILHCPPEIRAKAEAMAELLHDGCGDLLSEPLDIANTAHVTLHDLIAAPDWHDGLHMLAAEQRAKSGLILSETDGAPLRLRLNGTCFVMVNTSVCLGVEAATEADHERIQSLYQAYHGIVNIAHPLVLHLTLAYLRPLCYDESAVLRLRRATEAVRNMIDTEECFEMQPEFSCFESMKRYIPVFSES